MQEEWNPVRGSKASALSEVGFGALRAALLFGSTAAALALIMTPLLDRGTRSQSAVVSLADNLDMTATGSVSGSAAPQATSAREREGGRYTIHRSVLQSSPNAICIIRDNGSRIGDC